MNSPPLTLRLSQKLTGLVIFPLVVELVFFCFLFSLFKETEDVAARANHAKVVITQCNELTDLMFDAGTALAGYTVTRSEEFSNSYGKHLKSLSQNLRSLEILVQDNPKQRESFLKVQDASASGMNLFEQYRTSVSKSGQTRVLESAATMRGSLQTMVDTIMNSVQELVREERRISDLAPVTQSTLRQEIVFALFGGIVFNIIFAGVATFTLYKNIVTRLKVVVDNTKRILRRDQLLPRLKGKDEISQLDQNFHDMAEELERIAKHKQELISMVSHDLRSPLMSVQVSLELIESGALGELESRMNKEVGVASRNVKRLIELINDLLDIEKMEAGKMEMFIGQHDLVSIIESALDSVRSAADKKGIKIQKPLLGVTVDADKQRLIQVMVNLLSNAIKYSEENGEVGIEFTDNATETTVKIRDSGPGIKRELREKIFERFQQADAPKGSKEADRAAKGTGLGLAICKAIIAGHDGRIGVDSVEGEGSTFWFTLPHRAGSPTI